MRSTKVLKQLADDTRFSSPLSAQRRMKERLWHEFFSDPSQWWDHRPEKMNSRYPDFKHKTTHQALWLDGILTPPWVEAKLAAMAPRSIQPSTFQWNVRLARYVKAGQYENTIDLFKQMQREGIIPDNVTFVHVLKACSSSQALKEGQRVHEQIVRRGSESNVAVGSCLIDMYAKCGRIEDAQIVFDRMPTRDVVSWTTLILGYAKSGQAEKALPLLQQMQHEGVLPDRVMFVGLLSACASVAALDEGRQVHKLLIQRGWESDAFVGSSLVDMYAKCGSIKDAERVFNSISRRDVVCWTGMILGHVKSGQGREALELFQQMQCEGVKPDRVTFVGVLNACASLMALEEGRGVHKQIVENGCDSDVFVGTTLVDMYCKCGSIDEAQLVFRRMSTRNVVSWTAMILGLVKCGQGQKALELWQQMETEGVQPNQITFVGLLNACASVTALEEGRRVHRQIIERGCESNVFVGNSLVDMYAKCGSIEDAQRVFDRMTTHDVVSWTAMILGHVKCSQGHKALELLEKMQQEGVHPTPVTFVGLLNACASVSALEEGRHVHEQAIKSGCESDVFVCNSLIDMYAKCGSIEDAEKVFKNMGSRDVVSWTAMISGCVKCGQGHKALELFEQMQHDGVQPDHVTFVPLLNACASVGALEEGRRVHGQIIQNGFVSDLFVSSGLVDMYSKCGSIEDAQQVFNGMAKRDVVSWNTMIFGRVKCGQGLKALELFRQMQRDEGVQPDPVTFVAVLNACAGVAALEVGRSVHKQIIESNCESDAFVGSSLIDMYAKCGSIEDAEKVFNKIALRHNGVSWTAMLGAYAMHGLGKEALEHFEWMHKEGVEINGVTFLSLLSACSHAGLVDEGVDNFKAMNLVYDVSATAGHYACMVDLLGRAGRLQEAEDLINSSQHCTEDVTAWTALLGACRVHGNCEMGERVAKRVLELDPGNASGYMLLSNIYAAAGKWNLCASIHRQRLERGVRKDAGHTWIEMNSKVHTFVADDQHHPQMMEIHAELMRLSRLMHEAGYVPDTKFVLHDVEEEEKVSRLWHHSQKLAIAFGLISTPPGTPIRIFKNLRSCVHFEKQSKPEGKYKSKDLARCKVQGHCPEDAWLLATQMFQSNCPRRFHKLPHLMFEPGFEGGSRV